MKRKRHNDEGLFYSEEDRERLLSLPEIERERILYERHSERERKKEKREIERKLSTYISSEEDSVEEGEREREHRRHPSTLPYLSFKKIVLTRNWLASNIYKKNINNINNFFIKIRLANGYKIFRILRVYEDKKYAVGKDTTNKWLEVGNNSSREVVNIQSVSNGSVREEEYAEYRSNNKVPSDKEAEALEKRLREIERPMDAEGVEYMIKEKRKFKENVVKAKRKVEILRELEEVREGRGGQKGEGGERERELLGELEEIERVRRGEEQ